MQKMREFLYPRNGFRRAVEYLGHRLKRLPDSPNKVAKGIAVGVFTSFTPFFGFHFVIAAALAWTLRGNILAAIIGTFFGNPATFPVIVAVNLWLGCEVFGLGDHGGSGFEFEVVAVAFAKAFLGLWTAVKSLFWDVETPFALLSDFMTDLFIPYLVGGFLPGLFCSIVVYLIAVPTVQAYQKRRRDRLRKRAVARLKAQAAKAAASKQEG